MYKFLFVDDEDLIRELFVDILDFENYGFKLEKCLLSAEETLEYLKEHNNIDLVITDIKMGGMSGVELCEEIRKNNSDIELVIMSGYKEFEYAQKAIRYGVFDYLLKPTTYNDLDTLFNKLKLHYKNKKYKLTGNDLTDNVDYHYTHLVDTIKTYIKENYHSDISLEDVAKHVSMNSAYLSRFFKQQTGCNFIDYLSKVRINQAKELLQDNTIKVYEVCNMVGYKNTRHFYKIFKQIVGLTPSEFRNSISN